MSVSVPEKTFHLPKGLHYHCVQCGKSCRMFNEVFVEEASQRRLEQIEYRDLMPEAVREKSPLIPGASDPEKLRLRKHCGTCVFQRDDGLCGIHAKYEFETKPQTCQDFPFRYLDAPDGVYIGLSFACTAVLQNTGPAVTEQEADLRESYPRANSRRNCRGAIHLTNRHDISWDAYQLAEEAFERIMADDSQDFGMRLVAQSVYLDLFSRFLAEVRGHVSVPPSLPNSGPMKDADVVRALNERYLTKAGAPHLFRIARRIRGSRTLQRAFLGLVTAFRQNLYEEDERPSRFGAARRVFTHYAMHAVKLGDIRLIPLEGKFSYGAFARYPFPENDEAINELLQRYYRHSLFRKDLLTADSMWLAQRMMLMHYALIKWYAVGRASLEDRECIDLECVQEGIRAVELHYLFHTKFGELFEKFPTLGMILDGIVRRPVFAASMVGTPA